MSSLKPLSFDPESPASPTLADNPAAETANSTSGDDATVPGGFKCQKRPTGPRWEPTSPGAAVAWTGRGLPGAANGGVTRLIGTARRDSGEQPVVAANR